MADEDAGRTRRRDRTGGPESPRERDPADRGDSSGFSFSLPPISLPEMRLPERIRLVFPVPEPPERVTHPTRVRVSWVLLAVVLADVLDALAVLWAGPETLAWVRAAVGVLVGVVLVGGPGLLYAWELFAILGGFGALSFAPTLAALVLARLVLSE
ncbi:MULTISPECIES: hypothetical protein [Halorussus]|uniref:hypothetical protein n=1 Tax=Halorussus TaxID=1070314 RepID=UPI000E21852D|nr:MULTISPECIES: hypothetical protein [Halorussus]NHN59974.1 hypothetical protein [Halorussus sp. JP-T4]